MEYIGIKAIDFTESPPGVHGIAVMQGRVYDEKTKIKYLHTDAFFRVAKIDGSFYMYLSADEVSADRIREEIKALGILPL